MSSRLVATLRLPTDAARFTHVALLKRCLSSHGLSYATVPGERLRLGMGPIPVSGHVTPPS